MTLAPLLNFFAQLDTELHIQDIATVPCMLWFIGLMIWFFAAVGRRQGKTQKWKWILAYGFVLFAAYAAWSGLASDPGKDQGFGSYITNAFGVRAQYDSKKLVATLFVSFFGPVVSVFLMMYFDRREAQRMADLTS